MSSYFNLYLDTTPPKLNVIMPSYSTTNSIDEITITGSEELSDYQDIYIIDSQGKRFDLTFEHSSKSKFYGMISFQGMSMGIAKLFIRLKDTVSNISDTVIKVINILDSDNLTMSVHVKLKVAKISTLENDGDVEVVSKIAKVDTFENDGDVQVTENIAKINPVETQIVVKIVQI